MKRQGGASRGIDTARMTRWYDAQARFYSLRRDRFDGGHVRWVAGRLDPKRALRILDAACGTGLFSIGLALRGPAWSIEGVDLSEGCLGVGREHARNHGVENVNFSVGDVGRLRFDDGTFDVVNASGLLPVLNDPRIALSEFHRVLRPGGALYVIERDREALNLTDRIGFHTMVWGYRAISTLLPRYKFARGWNLERSTIDPASLGPTLREAGFEPGEVRRLDKHVIGEGFKPA